MYRCNRANDCKDLGEFRAAIKAIASSPLCSPRQATGLSVQSDRPDADCIAAKSESREDSAILKSSSSLVDWISATEPNTTQMMPRIRKGNLYLLRAMI